MTLRVSECALADVAPLIERVHYSHTCFGVTVTFCYGVYAEAICGGAIFGRPAAYNVSRKYDGGEWLLELRRFVLEDWCPRNSESQTLAAMLRDLKSKGVKRILSYADPAHGHQGTIYKATGFTLMGTTAKRKHWSWKGKTYPDRNLHQVHFPFHKELREAVRLGEAVSVAIPGKLCYVKQL